MGHRAAAPRTQAQPRRLRLRRQRGSLLLLLPATVATYMGVSGGRVALRVWDACCLGGWLLAAALVVERLQGGAWPPLRLALAAVLGGSPPTKSSLWYVGTLQAWPPMMDWNPISRLVAVLEAGRCIETVLILLGLARGNAPLRVGLLVMRLLACALVLGHLPNAAITHAILLGWSCTEAARYLSNLLPHSTAAAAIRWYAAAACAPLCMGAEVVGSYGVLMRLSAKTAQNIPAHEHPGPYRADYVYPGGVAAQSAGIDPGWSDITKILCVMQMALNCGATVWTLPATLSEAAAAAPSHAVVHGTDDEKGRADGKGETKDKKDG